MSNGQRKRGFVRGLVDFALDRDISEEIEAQQRILRLDPDSAAARLNLGFLFYSQGRVEDAIRELLISIECDGTQGRPYCKLGEIYVALGDYARAETYARMAAERGDSKLLDAFERYPQVLMRAVNAGQTAEPRAALEPASRERETVPESWQPSSV